MFKTFFRVVLWFVVAAYSLLVFAADWIGRSTILRETVQPMIEFISGQPSVHFYGSLAVLVLVGLSLHIPAPHLRKWLGLSGGEKDEFERKFMAEERARRRYAAADEVTRIRTILIDKTATKEQKKKAFHGAQYHSDMFWDEDQFADAWEDFYDACNTVYHAWIKWDAASGMAHQRLICERELNKATFLLNKRAGHLRARVLRNLA